MSQNYKKLCFLSCQKCVLSYVKTIKMTTKRNHWTTDCWMWKTKQTDISCYRRRYRYPSLDTQVLINWESEALSSFKCLISPLDTKDETSKSRHSRSHGCAERANQGTENIVYRMKNLIAPFCAPGRVSHFLLIKINLTNMLYTHAFIYKARENLQGMKHFTFISVLWSQIED